MTTLREAAQQALDALEAMEPPMMAGYTRRLSAITALKSALEQPEQDNFPEEKLQAVAEYFGDKYHVWYGIGARDVEEVLRQSVRRGLVTLNFDTGEQQQPEQEPVARFDERYGGPVLLASAPMLCDGQLLYTHPPRREPTATIDEMFDRMNKAPRGVFSGHDPMTIWMKAWRAAEQHHGIKEGA
jgi:hypothetical protein